MTQKKRRRLLAAPAVIAMIPFMWVGYLAERVVEALIEWAEN